MPEQLKNLRHDLRLTQEEMSKKIGVSRNYLALMETGRRNIPAAVRAKIVTLLPDGKKSFQPPPAVRESTAPYGCRFPADCDLNARLDGLQTEVHNMRGQIDTLLGLLGGPLRSAIGIGNDDDAGKAG